MPRRVRREPENLRRRTPLREPRRRILVVCEGGVTEAGYFKNLSRVFRNSLIEVEIDDQGGVPKTLVERAAARKREAEREARLKRHLPDYDKALPFERVHRGYSDAVSRAQELDRRREDAGDPGGNPSTGVYRLTERIRAGGQAGSSGPPA